MNGNGAKGDRAEASAEASVPTRGERRWLRALGLLFVALSFGIFHTFVLVAVPLALLMIATPGRRWLTLSLVVLIAATVFSGGPSGTGFWYLERGWALLVAGWFVALTLLWPSKTFTSRALGAVAGALAGGGLLYVLWPQAWMVTDWMIGSRISAGASTALEAMQLLRGENVLSPTLVATVHQTAEFQGTVFPALLALSTFAALGVAWWFYDRLVHGSDRGLGALRDFRFNDQLVWVLIGGIVLLLWGGTDGIQRGGTNAVVFMAMLYALRGTAVAFSLSGGFSFLGYLLLGTALLFAAPVVFAGALVIGLGDTWLDVRARKQATAV
ncbi:MAG: DUF2232 domain-containing protein [Gemmatimonadota bacterium]